MFPMVAPKLCWTVDVGQAWLAMFGTCGLLKRDEVCIAHISVIGEEFRFKV